MGQLHNELTNGLLSAALTAALGVTKTRGGIERFGETLQPVINLWDRPEWSWLRDERRYAGRLSQGPVAAEFGHIVIANPQNSGVISVIEALDVRSATVATTIDTSMLYTGWTGSVTRASLALSAGVLRMTDSRSGSATGLLRTEVWTGTDPAALGGIFVDNDTVAVGNQWLSQLAPPVILLPDSALIIVANTVNVFLAMRARGYERVARQGELV